jgi:hypothetical protein
MCFIWNLNFMEWFQNMVRVLSALALVRPVPAERRL